MTLKEGRALDYLHLLGSQIHPRIHFLDVSRPESETARRSPHGLDQQGSPPAHRSQAVEEPSQIDEQATEGEAQDHSRRARDELAKEGENRPLPDHQRKANSTGREQ